MLINGRPYTNENGANDITLLTDRKDVDYRIVESWIKENIRRSRSVSCHSSYGLKHIFNHDTGIYLTNNEFKDALLLAGYSSIDPNELNWRYRIKLKCEINDNTNPFRNWAQKYKVDHTPRGDFVRDMFRDMDFPIFAEHDIMESYLHYKCACNAAMEAFEELWEEYSKQK